MKKILLLIGIALLFNGCERTPDDRTETDGAGERGVYKFSYQGHQYIQFGIYHMQWGVHDPDCIKCKKL